MPLLAAILLLIIIYTLTICVYSNDNHGRFYQKFELPWRTGVLVLGRNNIRNIAEILYFYIDFLYSILSGIYQTN